MQSGEPLCAYEQERQERIERNRAFLAQLGIKTPTALAPGPAPTTPGFTPITTIGPNGVQYFDAEGNQLKRPRGRPRKDGSWPRPNPNPKPKPRTKEYVPSRISARQRGEAPEDPSAYCSSSFIGEDGSYSRNLQRSKSLQRPTQFTGMVSGSVYLRSMGVTVWDFGHVYRGPFAHRYWSSKSCLYHHVYPVGYRATKVHFKAIIEMTIEQDTFGPLFKIRDTTTGEVFTGTSPTHPWTAMCLAKGLGTRISGPLFYGFSDPITQKAISLQYTDEEAAAAAAGETVPCKEPSKAELAVRSLCTLEGMGELTAIALATTRMFEPHGHSAITSVEALTKLCQQDRGALLTEYLTERWPAWTKKAVPALVRVLLGEEDPDTLKENGNPNKRARGRPPKRPRLLLPLEQLETHALTERQAKVKEAARAAAAAKAAKSTSRAIKTGRSRGSNYRVGGNITFNPWQYAVNPLGLVVPKRKRTAVARKEAAAHSAAAFAAAAHAASAGSSRFTNSGRTVIPRTYDEYA